MQLNFLAYGLITLLMILLGILWYRPRSPFVKWSKIKEIQDPLQIPFWKYLILFPVALLLVFGYINLVIHQVGFYELFFTDIMKGSEEAKQITEDFLAKYGDKHRHFGHGLFHGGITAFTFPLPILLFIKLLENKSGRWLGLHFSYWLFTSILIGGLIAAFV